mmetsp:Transcript_5650/g.13199  ORF Transcript_5650/g.13199 Transcript_5650/m.13199 type:complete len:379 (-) Transcript_5650:415-1551(-)
MSLASAASSNALSRVSSRAMFHLICASMARISRTSFLVSSSMRWNSCTDCGCMELFGDATEGELVVARASVVGSLRATSATEFVCPGVRLPNWPALFDPAIRAVGEAFAGDCCAAGRGLAARREGLWPGLAAVTACFPGGCGLAERRTAGESGVAMPDLFGLGALRGAAASGAAAGVAPGDLVLTVARAAATPAPAGMGRAGAFAVGTAATARPPLGRGRWQVAGLGRGLTAVARRGLTAARCLGTALGGLEATATADCRMGFPARWADFGRVAAAGGLAAAALRGAGRSCCCLSRCMAGCMRGAACAFEATAWGATAAAPPSGSAELGDMDVASMVSDPKLRACACRASAGAVTASVPSALVTAGAGTPAASEVASQ